MGNRFCRERLTVSEQMAVLLEAVGKIGSGIEPCLQPRPSRSNNPLAARSGDHDGAIMIGLTAEETREFRRLDSLPPHDDNGGLLPWLWGSAAPQGQEARWLELYLKHERACRLRWMDRSGSG